MKRCFRFLSLLLSAGAFALASAAAEPVTLVLEGTLTNTSIGDTTAAARLELRIEGETVNARLVTEKPLSGTGELTGRLLGGWLELSGKLEGGFTVQFRGALSPRDYRGTYIAAVPGELVQYGRFTLKRESPR